MQTRPVIMPWTAPMTEGLLKKMASSDVHIRRLVAAQMLVFRTAMEESILAAYGSPPLNPAHPSHSNPAPANVNNHYKKRGFRPRLKNAAIDPKNAAIGYSRVFYSRVYKRGINTAAIVL